MWWRSRGVGEWWWKRGRGRVHPSLLGDLPFPPECSTGHPYPGLWNYEVAFKLNLMCLESTGTSLLKLVFLTAK